MISKLKVTDGDMVFLNIEATDSNDVSTEYLERIRKRVQDWLKTKGLNNVEVVITGGSMRVDISVLSVNDVFENSVLGANNG